MKLIKSTHKTSEKRHQINLREVSLRLLCMGMASAAMLIMLTGCRHSSISGAQLLEQGVQALNRNDLISSYQYTLQALDAIDQQSDSGTYLEAQTFLGILYHTMGQRQEAFDVFKALPTDSARGRRHRVFMLSLNCLAYYTATIEKDYSKALAYSHRIIQIDKGETDLNMLYSDRLNMAELYVMAGDTSKARAIVNSVDTAKIVSTALPCQTQLWLVKAKLLMMQKNYSQARIFANRLIDKSNSYWDINNSIDALDIIIKIDSLNGDINSYIHNRNRIDALRNQVQGEQIKYKLLLTEQQYKLENMRISLAKRRMLYNCGIVLLLIIAVSLALISYIQYRKNKMQKRINEMERNNFDADIQRKRLENELLTLKMQKQKEELTQAYQDNVSMSMMLEESPDSNSYATRLDYLESVLKRQYGDFMKRLSRRYPRLSYNESLIIGFTRMKLSSKDIATALGISQESLTKARYRLRKKIGVASAEELDNIIEAI